MQVLFSDSVTFPPLTDSSIGFSVDVVTGAPSVKDSSVEAFTEEVEL